MIHNDRAQNICSSFVDYADDVINQKLLPLIRKIYQFIIGCFCCSDSTLTSGEQQPPITEQYVIGPVNLGDAVVQNDLLSMLPRDLQDIIFSQLQLKDFAALGRVCKQWQLIQHNYLEKHQTKYLAQCPYDARSWMGKKEKWDTFFANMPNLKHVNAINWPLFHNFFPYTILHETLPVEQCEMIRQHLEPYIDHYLLTTTDEISPWHIYVLLTTLSNNLDWVKTKLTLFLQNENYLEENLLRMSDKKYIGWSICWSSWIGLTLVDKYSEPYYRTGVAPDDIIEMLAQGFITMIRKKADQADNQKTLHLYFDFDVQLDDFESNLAPTQAIIAPLLKYMMNLPQTIEDLYLFKNNLKFVFTDDNARDLSHIITTNPHLKQLSVDISSMTEEGKSIIREALAYSSLDSSKIIGLI